MFVDRAFSTTILCIAVRHLALYLKLLKLFLVRTLLYCVTNITVGLYLSYFPFITKGYLFCNIQNGSDCYIAFCATLKGVFVYAI